MMIRGRRWQESPVTGESAKETVKTIRAGNAGPIRRTCGDYARVLFSFARETAGAVGAPGVPCALFFRGRECLPHDPGAKAPREYEGVPCGIFMESL
jgi:hypothetical protein